MSALSMMLPSNGSVGSYSVIDLAADVDVAAVARLGRRRGLPAWCRPAGWRCIAARRQLFKMLSITTPRTVVPTRVVAQRGEDHRHALLAGRLVAGNAQDPQLRSRHRDRRAGLRGRIDAVVDADDEPGTRVFGGAEPVEPAVGLQVGCPASLGVSSLSSLTMTDWPGLGMVSPSASNVPGSAD